MREREKVVGTQETLKYQLRASLRETAGRLFYVSSVMSGGRTMAEHLSGETGYIKPASATKKPLRTVSKASSRLGKIPNKHFFTGKHEHGFLKGNDKSEFM